MAKPKTLGRKIENKTKGKQMCFELAGKKEEEAEADNRIQLDFAKFAQNEIIGECVQIKFKRIPCQMGEVLI